MILHKLCNKLSSLHLNLIQQIRYSKDGIFNALPDTVFNVVKNTHQYSQFIPWCSRSSIIKPISNTQNFTQLTITFQKVKELSYLSHVQISGQNNLKQKYKIQSVCKQQPLKHLISIWEIDKNSIIEGDSQQTKVHYSIQYEFASPLLQLTSHLFLNYVGESMWLIFKQQAQKRQKQLNLQHNKNIKDEQNKISFGKSDRINDNKAQQTRFVGDNEINEKQVNNLGQYLSRNEKIHEIYIKNRQFKQKLDQWSKLLDGTKNFGQKLQFKIRNYLIHKN